MGSTAVVEQAVNAAKMSGEDMVWECQCGCLEFWIESKGFRCCDCKIIANFGDIKFD